MLLVVVLFAFCILYFVWVCCSSVSSLLLVFDTGASKLERCTKDNKCIKTNNQRWTNVRVVVENLLLSIVGRWFPKHIYHIQNDAERQNNRNNNNNNDNSVEKKI